VYPKKGTHIRVKRAGRLYWHGIADGEGYVIHYAYTTNAYSLVCKTTLEDFSQGADWEPVLTVEAKYNPDEILERANSRIGQHFYSPASCDSEIFAKWCVAGIQQSQPISRTSSSTRKLSGILLKSNEQSKFGDADDHVNLNDQIAQWASLFDNPSAAEAKIRRTLQEYYSDTKDDSLRNALIAYFSRIAAQRNKPRTSALDFDLPSIIEVIDIRSGHRNRQGAMATPEIDNTDGAVDYGVLTPEDSESLFDPGIHITDPPDLDPN
jgi:HRAS-like suppressor 3